MLIHQPHSVTFGGTPLPDVASIAIDRTAAREALEWSDAGPHAVFADIPEQRTTITLVRAPSRGELTPLLPAQMEELTFVYSAAGTPTDALRRRVTAMCVVRDVRHALDHARGTSRQIITMIAVALSGDSNPVTITTL